MLDLSFQQKLAVRKTQTQHRLTVLKYCKAFLQEGFPNSSVGKESACNAGHPVRFLSQGDPLEKGYATHSSILRLPLWLSW